MPSSGNSTFSGWVTRTRSLTPAPSEQDGADDQRRGLAAGDRRGRAEAQLQHLGAGRRGGREGALVDPDHAEGRAVADPVDVVGPGPVGHRAGAEDRRPGQVPLGVWGGVGDRVAQVEPVRPDLQRQQHQQVPPGQRMLPGQGEHPAQAGPGRRLPQRRPQLRRQRLGVDPGAVQGDHGLPELEEAGADLLEDVGGDAVALAGQAEQQVLGADPVLLQLPGLAGGQAEHAGDRLGHGQVVAGRVAPGPGPGPADRLLDPAAECLDLDSVLAEGGGGQAPRVAEEGQQEVLGVDPVAAEPPGLPRGMADGELGALGDPHRRTSRGLLGHSISRPHDRTSEASSERPLSQVRRTMATWKSNSSKDVRPPNQMPRWPTTTVPTGSPPRSARSRRATTPASSPTARSWSRPSPTRAATGCRSAASTRGCCASAAPAARPSTGRPCPSPASTPPWPPAAWSVRAWPAGTTAAGASATTPRSAAPACCSPAPSATAPEPPPPRPPRPPDPPPPWQPAPVRARCRTAG